MQPASGVGALSPILGVTKLLEVIEQMRRRPRGTPATSATNTRRQATLQILLLGPDVVELSALDNKRPSRLRQRAQILYIVAAISCTCG